MSSRKQTPDLLSQLMDGESYPDEFPKNRQAIAAPPTVRSVSIPRKQSDKNTRQPSATKLKGWNTQVASFQNLHGWRLRYIDGKEVKDWSRSMLIHQYLAYMGENGWELTSATSGQALFGLSDTYQLFFQKPS